MLWLRRIGGTLAGVILFGVVVTLIELITWKLFPLPPGIDPSDPAQMARVVETIPVLAKIGVLKAYFLGALVGGWVALLIARWQPAVWIVVLLAWVGSAMNIATIPHPLWMAIGSFVAPALGGWLAVWLDGWIRRRRSAA